MNYKDLADLIFPNEKDISYMEDKYPIRNLKEGAAVVRFAPSPTGFVHIGSLFSSLIDYKLARQTEGVFILRIEDTDQKRELENGIIGILDSLKDFKIVFDEGMIGEEAEKGEYGPYKQSQRGELYRSCAKYLIEKGSAYPCFCSGEDLEEKRQKQEKAKIRPGYYDIWATCRNLSVEEQIEKIKKGDPYILRLKSPGHESKKVRHHDLIKGNIEFPENDQDIVIIKSDGLPTYHFAHSVDDHFMRTTHVIRGDEWVPSIPIHLQLFQALGFKTPKFAHIAPIMKEENGAKRKISKRKDKEAAVSYYHEVGIPAEAVMEYLLNIANSNFEGWRKGNPDKSIDKFEFALNKMGISGALFDMTKLLDISKTIISKYDTKRIYEESLSWAEKYDDELKELLTYDLDYAMKVLGIERGNIKPRKDIAKWEDVKDIIIYMFDDKFYNTNVEYPFMKITDKSEITKLLKLYIENHYDPSDDKETWFNRIKDLAEELGYAREVKEFKANPGEYKGHVGDVSTVLRIILTGRQNTPDLYEIMQVLGKESIEKRINTFIG